MKDYLLLLRAGIPAVNRTEEENKADMEAWGAFMGGLAQNGQLSGGLPLVSGGKTVFATNVVDEPVNASEGIVGGYLIVKTESLEEAVEIAKACPHIANEGNIEVREIAPMPAM